MAHGDRGREGTVGGTPTTFELWNSGQEIDSDNDNRVVSVSGKHWISMKIEATVDHPLS